MNIIIILNENEISINKRLLYNFIKEIKSKL